jgi:hypothetical protein
MLSSPMMRALEGSVGAVVVRVPQLPLLPLPHLPRRGEGARALPPQLAQVCEQGSCQSIQSDGDNEHFAAGAGRMSS